MSDNKVVATAAVGDEPDNTVDHDHEDEGKTTSPWRRVVGLIWESAEGTPRNRKYVHKIDGYMLYVDIVNTPRIAG